MNFVSSRLNLRQIQPSVSEVDLENLNPSVIDRHVNEQHLIEASLANHLREAGRFGWP